MLRNKGIVFRLTVYTLSVVAIMVVAILIYNYRLSREYILEDARKDAKTLTSLTINQIENILNRVELIPMEFAYYLEYAHDSRIDLELMISTILQRFSLISGACVAYSPGMYLPGTLYHAPYFYRQDGVVKTRNLAMNGYNYWEKDWFIRPVKDRRPSWSEPYFDKGGGDALMSTYSVPFYLRQGGDSVVAGVVTVDISLDRLQELVSSIRLYQSGYAILITPEANIVTHPMIPEGGERQLHKLHDNAAGAELSVVFDMISEQKSGLISMDDRAGSIFRKDWISFDVIPSNGWFLVIIFNENELYAEVRALTYQLLFIGIAGIVILGLLLFLVSRSITRPLISLVSSAREIGKGQMSAPLPRIRTHDEVGQLGEAFRFMQGELQQYMMHLREATIEKEKIESEIRIAARIQNEMLPGEIPGILSGGSLELAARVIPARIIGGDLYDYVLLEENKLFFLIGDVSGKGIPAALFMARTITLFRAKVTGNTNIADVIMEMNRELSVNNSDAMFTTVFAGMIDLDHNTIDFCNAGHNPPVILNRDGSILTLDDIHGVPVGVMEDTVYASSRMNLQPGSLICLYSDGITEAENVRGEFFGVTRLRENILKAASCKPACFLDAILDEVSRFTSGEAQSDDITLLVIAIK